MPFVSLYLPGTHATHGPPSGPVYPTLHGQRLVPATESEFGGQRGQADEFRQFLYLPASHATHGPASGPVNPGAQRQMLSPAFAIEFSAHPRHDVTDVAVEMLWNVFAAHSVHASLPLVALYVPARHVVHWPFEGPMLAPVYPRLHAQSIPGLYTSTSGNCKKPPLTTFNDTLRNRAVPSHV